jgi:outer membrane beta-barrel protein
MKLLRKKNYSKWCLVLLAAMALASIIGDHWVMRTANADQFDDYEIRVIRPKYFQKKGRFELGAQVAAIMNETFVYTYLASGLMTYHFNEYFALEGMAAYGFSLDREEKDTLQNQFDIRTQIFRTTYALEGNILWTPIYGKWQLPTGRLIYFDSYLSVGGGINGIYWNYEDFCVQTNTAGGGIAPIPANATVAYPAFSVGFGQRYFLNKFLAIKWDIRNHFVIYNVADTECAVNPTVTGTDVHNNVTLQFGASRFF